MDDRSPPRLAGDWLIELLEHPQDAGLRQRHDAWLAADPANAADWAEIQHTFELLRRTTPALGDRWSPAADSRAARAGSGRRRRVAGAIALALAACLAAVALPGVLVRLSADAVTGTAETSRMLLADGSIVRLAPDSALAVEIAGGERRVRLLRGTAFFEVHPDPDRPFRVATESLEATVLGTAFEVATADRSTRVAVQEGSVRVDGPALLPPVTERLGAGDTLRVSTGGVVRGRLPADQVAAWRDGLLLANDRSVAEVVDDLRPYFDGLLVLRGDRLAAQPLTGVYRLADPAAALEAIAAAQGAAVYRISPWLLVVAGD